MNTTITEYLEECLYFTVAKLSRIITKMAEDAFAVTGMSPNYAFLLIVVYEKQQISPKELSEILHITPSTTTRFLDKLEHKGYIVRAFEGKNCMISLTEKGQNIQGDLENAWDKLYADYCQLLGEDEANHITELINQAAKKLNT